MPTLQAETGIRMLERRIAGSGEARLLETVLARKAPDFYIVDADLNVHLRGGEEAHVGIERLPEDVRVAVKQLLESEPLDSAVVAVRRDLAMRVLRLHGTIETRYALFFEPYRGRDLIDQAVKRFGLTSREGAVLDLVLRGAPTSEIAERLHITDGTVHQHIKNLGAKIGVTRRNAIVATVLGLVAA
jgi:DNA-binding NarL/FixJ family response regulator